MVDPVDKTGKTDAQIIKEASVKETIVWERPDETRKRNMTVDQVKEMVSVFPDDVIPHIFIIHWEPRISDQGVHATTAEKMVFVIEYNRKRFSQTRKYYFKGFLFHDHFVIGSEYQSAREDLWNVIIIER